MAISTKSHFSGLPQWTLIGMVLYSFFWSLTDLGEAAKIFVHYLFFLVVPASGWAFLMRNFLRSQTSRAWHQILIRALIGATIGALTAFSYGLLWELYCAIRDAKFPHLLESGWEFLLIHGRLLIPYMAIWTTLSLFKPQHPIRHGT